MTAALLLVLALGGLGALLLLGDGVAAARGRGPRVHRRLGAFVRSVERARAGDGRLTDVVYQSALRNGRRVWIRFGLGPRGSARVRVAVATCRGVPPVGVRLEGALSRLGKRLGRREDIQTGDVAFDERFFLESSRPLDGRRALGRELRQSVDEAFRRFGADRLHLRPGELAVEADLTACPPGRWRELIRHLDRAAALVEVKPLRIRGLEGERDVACGVDGAARCVYCRDGLSGDEDDLVACERCRTAVHAECWDEHGGCPVLGCDGRAPERPRLRA
ncbi:MAG: hypothetical protein M9894_35980 [Planctomycetes bacterium]|nr:hypothetical protein [Planctomycetota bacterium]